MKLHELKPAEGSKRARRRVGRGIGSGTRGLMALVDIPRVGLGFIEITVQTEAEIPAQRTVQAKVGAFG